MFAREMTAATVEQNDRSDGPAGEKMGCDAVTSFAAACAAVTLQHQARGLSASSEVLR